MLNLKRSVARNGLSNDILAAVGRRLRIGRTVEDDGEQEKVRSVEIRRSSRSGGLGVGKS